MIARLLTPHTRIEPLRQELREIETILRPKTGEGETDAEWLATHGGGGYVATDWS